MTHSFNDRRQKATAGGSTAVYAYLRSDGRPYYVGVTTGPSRVIDQKGHRKHGISVPKDRSRVVFLRGPLTKQAAAAWESFYVSHFGRKDLGTGILHNRSAGGEGLQEPSLKTRAKISAFMRTRPVSPKQIESIRLIGLRPKSERTKRLMSESQKGRKMSPFHQENFSQAMEARVAANAAAKGLTVAEHKAEVKAQARAKERDRKAAIRAQAAELGMSKRSYDQWLSDGSPSDMSPYLKPLGPVVQGGDQMGHRERRQAERDSLGLSERQYRLWVTAGRPENVAHFRGIYGKPGRPSRNSSLVA